MCADSEIRMALDAHGRIGRGVVRVWWCRGSADERDHNRKYAVKCSSVEYYHSSEPYGRTVA